MVTSRKPLEPSLEQLLAAERRARERYDRLAGYPDDIRAAAHALWKAASAAVADFRKRHSAERE